MEPRAVSAAHGWVWIVQGYVLFRKSPAMWLSLLILLFFTTKVLLRVPLAGLVFVLFMPLFIAGLMEGCRALEHGKPLELGHLFAGFRRNATPLVTIGGLSLVGNIGVMIIFAGMFLAMPFSMALGQYDFALLMLAPVVLPSIYASYKDVFLAGTAPEPGAAPNV